MKKENKLVLFKRIEIDLDPILQRINNANYNTRQKNALLKLIELFKKGDWNACLKHCNDKKAFPYNRQHEYRETEHIDEEIARVLYDVVHNSYFTKDELLKQAQEHLEKNKKK